MKKSKANHSGGIAPEQVGTENALGAPANGGGEPSEVFFDLTRRLSTKFNINKGVLLLKADMNAPLAAVSTWNNGQMHEGLSIKLPSDSSLFERVAEQGSVYTENFCDSFSGNFFERKLLLDDDSRSFVLQPLKHEGEVIGLLGFSSEKPTAFTLFEEGDLDDIVTDFAGVIREKISFS